MRQRKTLSGFVFRNLHQEGVTYSVRNSEGKTILHTYGVVVKNPKFVVQPGGRARVLQTGKKTVHAGVKGEIVLDPLEINDIIFQFSGKNKAYYNPYKYETFVTAEGQPIFSAEYAFLTSEDGKAKVMFF